MTKKNDLIWKTIQVVCWIIFAGYCVQTGALLFNYIYSLFIPAASHNLHLGLDLSELYVKSMLVYTIIFFLVILISTLKTLVFYHVIKLFKILNLVKPFSIQVSDIIRKITYLSFSAGMAGFLTWEFAGRLAEKELNPGNVLRYLDESGAYLMISAVLFVIALVFQKGIELQNENELTV